MDVDKLRAKYERYIASNMDAASLRKTTLPILEAVDWQTDVLQVQILAEDYPARVRLRLAGVLGALAGRAAEAAVLKELSSEPRFELREEAIELLGHTGSRRALAYLERLVHLAPQPGDRRAAVYALKILDADRAVPHIVYRLTDPDEHPEVKAEAAEAIGGLGVVSCVPLLIELLQAEHLEVRFWAAYALGVIGHTRALPELCKLAESANDSIVVDGIRTLRDEARWAVANICRHPQLLDPVQESSKKLLDLFPDFITTEPLFLTRPKPCRGVWVCLIGLTDASRASIAVWGREPEESSLLAVRILVSASVFQNILQEEATQTLSLLSKVTAALSIPEPREGEVQ